MEQQGSNEPQDSRSEAQPSEVVADDTASTGSCRDQDAEQTSDAPPTQGGSGDAGEAGSSICALRARKTQDKKQFTNIRRGLIVKAQRVQMRCTDDESYFDAEREMNELERAYERAEGTITDLAGLYEAESNAREKDKMISELEVLQRQFDEATDLAFEIVRTTHGVPVASAETQQYTGNSDQQCRDEAREVGGWWPGHVYGNELSAGPLGFESQPGLLARSLQQRDVNRSARGDATNATDQQLPFDTDDRAAVTGHSISTATGTTGGTIPDRPEVTSAVQSNIGQYTDGSATVTMTSTTVSVNDGVSVLARPATANTTTSGSTSSSSCKVTGPTLPLGSSNVLPSNSVSSTSTHSVNTAMNTKYSVGTQANPHSFRKHPMSTGTNVYGPTHQPQMPQSGIQWQAPPVSTMSMASTGTNVYGHTHQPQMSSGYMQQPMVYATPSNIGNQMYATGLPQMQQNQARAEPWKQLQRVGIPIFSGDKRTYESFREAFMACVDSAPATPQYKLLQLRQYLAGDALTAIERFGYSPSAYDAAKKLLERKYGGERRRVALHIEQIDSMSVVRANRPKEMEHFAELLAVAVVNMKDSGRAMELGHGTFYLSLLRKLDERNLAQYHRWRHDKSQPETVEVLLEWVNLEAEFLVVASETVSGFSGNAAAQSQPAQSASVHRRQFTSRTPPMFKNTARTFANAGIPANRDCPACNGLHPLWKCAEFKFYSVGKRWQVAKQANVCFRCLSYGHTGKECSKTYTCGIDGCKDTHHRTLHDSNRQGSCNAVSVNQTAALADSSKPRSNHTSKSSPSSDKASSKADNKVHGTALSVREGECNKPSTTTTPVSLRTVPVILRNANRQVVVNAILDDGSTMSYINADVAAELGLQGHTEKVTISTLNGRQETFSTTPVSVNISGLDGRETARIEARTTRRVVGDLPAIDWRQHGPKWKHLKGIQFPAINDNRGVDLLIGNDHANLHESLRDIRGQPGEPIARLTPLGWTCVGPTATTSHAHTAITLYAGDRHEMEADTLLRRFWELEKTDSDLETAFSPDDQTIVDATVKSMVKNDQRHQVSVPWRKDGPQLPNNQEMAMQRLRSTERRLAKQPDVAASYDKIIQQYVEKGYVRLVLPGEPPPPSKWLLPHFPVLRPDKSTTKVRIVFDASARLNGVSLNDTIHQGPKLQQDLAKVLLRFRKNPIAVACDISEMYLQIHLAEEDRPYHRFLWRSDPGRDNEPDEYEFTRVVFGVNCSPFLAQLVTQEHAKANSSKWPQAAETVLQSTYMDDSLDSAPSVADAISLYRQLSDLWSDTGMVARKWISNSKEVLEQIPATDRALQVDLSKSDLPSVKTLGVQYDATSDAFSFKLSPLPETFQFTKRNVLKRVATIFDPLGLLAPLTIRAKMLLQDMWADGVAWDDPLDPQLCQAVRQWFEELPLLASVAIPRCLQPPDQPVASNVQCHIFADASEKAYGAVAYYRVQGSTEEVTSRLIAAKSRVAPLSTTSIPRLELQAAVIATQLARQIANALALLKSALVFWTDSMNVLYWIRGQSKRYKTFVANRVSEIQGFSEPAQWHHVPTEQNPANKISRGCSVQQVDDSMWWNGPSYLLQDATTWPQRVETKVNVETMRKEEKKEQQQTNAITSLFQTAADNDKTTGPSNQQQQQWRLDPERFGSWSRLLRARALVRRFVTNCRTIKSDRMTGPLSSAEISDAETEVLKMAQHDAFSDEIKVLGQRKVVSARSELSPMNPMIDDNGVLRCQGRLAYAEYLPEDTVHPIILPRHHPVTQLIIRHYHELAQHVGGTNHILANISARFWINAAREAIREMERKCPRCKLLKAKPAHQIMAPLPRTRITPSFRAFARTGVDFAGPFTTVQGRGRKRQKRYLCLFTCLATRAVHLELAYGLDTSSFLNAFYRFVGRRGLPQHMLSDNGTNFVGAQRELQELHDALDQDCIVRTTADQGIHWQFNPPAAPHFGGSFEVMVRAAKRAIYAILGNAETTDEELTSALVGAESLINSRPLTYQSSHPLDETPLTPNHFLFGQMGGVFAPSTVDHTSFNPQRRWRRVQELVRHFWERWIKEWLPSLSARQKWKKPQSEVQVGDVMLLLSPDTPRGHWPLARVLETYPGRDGHVRVAKVKVGEKTFVRPIARLCPLEATPE
ncbi:uncharacterized protein LOC135823588 [Sycon ciliatum]|uniref:uncharacterized protein LOC135823588 n=1 Tax=Sycon ciliatum TaxID=27933 RepID=UPI0031F5F714